jgi:hypothetical protein
MTNCAEAMTKAMNDRRVRDQARIDAIVAEFDGGTDAPAALRRMAEELIYWRTRMRQISDVVAKVQAKEPFAVIGAGRHWHPGERKKPGWWR